MTGSSGGKTMNEQQNNPLVTSAPDPANAKQEQQLSAEQIMHMHAQPLVWHCRRDGCDGLIRFDGAQLESVPFLIVRHFIRAHGLDPDAIACAETSLNDAVDDYCRRMAVRR